MLVLNRKDRIQGLVTMQWPRRMSWEIYNIFLRILSKSLRHLECRKRRNSAGSGRLGPKSRDWKSHARSHVTSTWKVMCEDLNADSYSTEFIVIFIKEKTAFYDILGNANNKMFCLKSSTSFHSRGSHWDKLHYPKWNSVLSMDHGRSWTSVPGRSRTLNIMVESRNSVLNVRTWYCKCWLFS